MIFLGIILSIAAIGFFCWLLFTLAVFALPLFAGVTAGGKEVGITPYGRRGIKVSCLCPQSVETRMTAGGAGSAGINGVLSADAVAQSVLDTMAQESFLCLPHPEVASYVQRKAQDYDRWLGGMQKMYQHYIESGAGHAASAGPIPRPDRST